MHFERHIPSWTTYDHRYNNLSVSLGAGTDSDCMYVSVSEPPPSAVGTSSVFTTGDENFKRLSRPSRSPEVTSSYAKTKL